MPVASKSASRTPRSRSIRGILIGIVIACVVPGWLGMAALIQAVYTSERERTAQDLIVTARAIALALDGYLLFTRTTLEVMATAPDLQSGDLAAFHKRISALAGKLPGNNILLTDRSGQQLINTFMPFGASLPTHAKPENLDRVFSTGRPIITDLFVGAVAKRPLVAVEVPVFRDGEVKYVLSAGLFPEHLSELLVLQKLPPGWGVAIYDTSGITVARSSRIADFVGQRGPPEVIDMMARRVSGFAETVTLEGIPVFGALSRSETSDWAVGIGVPVAEINRNLYRFLEVSGAGAFLLLVAMVGLAAHQSRRITSAVQALVGPVAAFGQGEVPSIPPSGIREIDGVAQGFEQALRVLQHRTDERDLAAREKEVAERAARAKGEFIGTVSHELRTPLTSITASLALLKNTADAGRSAATTRLIEIAHSNSQRLARLVNDILDIEKLEAGKVVFDMQLVEVDALVERAIEVNGPMAESCRVKLRLESPSPHAVLADPDRLMQVASNLLSNAIKFSPPETEVVVTVEDRDGNVRVSVRDHGPGIPDSFKSRMFEKFAQADNSDTRQKTGTGLGLSIVKEIVQRLGGTVGFGDAPGGGTVFFVDLPRVERKDGGEAGARALLREIVKSLMPRAFVRARE